MARRAEPGIAYYQMNCGHTTNKKIRLLFNEFDSNGYWIWQCILDHAYDSKGYYFDCSDKDALELFATDVCKKQVSLVNEVIQGCIRRGLFQKSVFDTFGMLTSVMMQETYIEATYERRRKGTEIRIFKELLLIEIPEETKNVFILPWNLEILPRNNQQIPPHNPQSKVKESKVKESRESTHAGFDISKSNLFKKPTIPILEDVERNFLSRGGTQEQAKVFFEKNESTGWFLKGSPITNYAALISSFIQNWNKNEFKNGKIKQNSKHQSTVQPGTVDLTENWG
jgi:hypothetical protein